MKAAKRKISAIAALLLSLSAFGIPYQQIECSSQKTLPAGKAANVALIGCGHRGTAALENMLEAAKATRVKVIPAAFCDWFREKAIMTASQFNENAKVFSGANGYKQVMQQPDIDIVILATPPCFRPMHFMEAVKSGKHVFEEKPVAVDPAGVRLHLEACYLALSNGLTVVAGTQRRHSVQYNKQWQLLQSGKIGKVVSGTVRWNTGTKQHNSMFPNFKPFEDFRKGNVCSTNDHYVMNWYYYEELSGDHIVEQHVHNIDIANWFIGRWPVSATGFGGRAKRDEGNIYDFFITELDYGDDVKIVSECRQIDGCIAQVGETFRTDKNAVIDGGKTVRSAEVDCQNLADNWHADHITLSTIDPYVLEHIDLLQSVAGAGQYCMDGFDVTGATAAAILGRLSAKTGKTVWMKDILEDKSSEFYGMNASLQASDLESSTQTGKDLDAKAVKHNLRKSK